MFAILISVLSVQINQVVVKESDLTREITVKDMIKATDEIKFTPQTFNFAISLRSINENFLKDTSRYFRVVLLYEKGVYDYQAQSQDIIEEEVVDAPNCSEQNFPLSEDEKQIYNITSMYCFDTQRKNSFVKGGWVSLENQNVAVTVRSCRVAAT